jgi:hypothetical protein
MTKAEVGEQPFRQPLLPVDRTVKRLTLNCQSLPAQALP